MEHLGRKKGADVQDAAEEEENLRGANAIVAGERVEPEAGAPEDMTEEGTVWKTFLEASSERFFSFPIFRISFSLFSSSLKLGLYH